MNPENETHKTVKNSCHASEDFYKDFSSGEKIVFCSEELT